MIRLKGCKRIQDLLLRSLLTNKTVNHFSVKDKMTYGYDYRDASSNLIFHKLNQLNYQYKSIENMEKYLPLKISQMKISVEDPKIREFNFFEVIAHCLHIEMEEKIKDNSQLLSKKLFFLYDRVQEIVKALIGDDQNKTSSEKHVIHCEKQIARKQILRRFYQMCKYYGNPKQLQKFIKLMDQQSSKIAKQIKDYIMSPAQINRFSADHKIKTIQFPLLQVINQIIDKYSPTKEQYQKLSQKQGKFHYSVGNKFRAMFSHFSRINNMQNRFMGDNPNFNLSKNKYFTVSFIPTSTTTFIFQSITSNIKCSFFSGYRKIGKSFSLFLFWQLQNEIKEQKNIYIPDLNQFHLLGKTLWPIIIDTYWRVIPPNLFKQKQQQINSKLQNNTDEQNYKIFSNVTKWLSRFGLNKIIFDQFSSLISIFHKQRRKYYVTKDEQDQVNAFKMFFRNYKMYNQDMQLAFCSSICVEKQQIRLQLGIKNINEQYFQMQTLYSNQQAYYLTKIWVIKQINLYIFAKNQSIEPIYSTQHFKEIFYSKIDAEIEKLKYFYMNEYQTKTLEGTMQFIKQPARLIFMKIINEIFNLSQTKNEINWKKQSNKYAVQYYKSEIQEWIQKGDLSKKNEPINQQQKKWQQQLRQFRRRYVTSLLRSTDSRQLQSQLKYTKFYKPYFLCTKQEKLRSIVMPFRKSLFQSLEYKLLVNDKYRLNYYKSLQKQKNICYASAFGIEFQYQIHQNLLKFDQNFSKQFRNYVFHNPKVNKFSSLFIDTDQINFFVKKIVEAIKENTFNQLKFDTLYFTSRFRLKACDGIYVYINKRQITQKQKTKNSKLQQKLYKYTINVCHIECGISKTPGVLKKYQYVAQEQYKSRFIQFLKHTVNGHKGILKLGSYKILLFNIKNENAKSNEKFKIYKQNKNLIYYGILDNQEQQSIKQKSNLIQLAEIYHERINSSLVEKKYYQNNCQIMDEYKNDEEQNQKSDIIKVEEDQNQQTSKQI